MQEIGSLCCIYHAKAQRTYPPACLFVFSSLQLSCS